MTTQKMLMILDPLDERWLNFINERPDANIFHHPAWINLLAECYGYHPYIIAVNGPDGKICAGLPLMDVKSFLTGHRWVSLPFTDHCAPLYTDNEALIRLAKELVFLSESNGMRRIELRWEYPTHPSIQQYSHFVLHTVKLNPDPEIVFRRMQKKIRQLIHVAEKRGVRVDCGTSEKHLRLFYHYQVHTRRRHGIPPQPWGFFKLLGQNLLESGLGFVLLAYKENVCIAGKVVLYWQKTLTFKFQASNEEYLDLHPNHLLSWTAIRWACENGLAMVDMGRSGNLQTGLYEFKSRWGAEEKPLIYSTISSPPPELTIGKLMTIMNFFIQKSPVWVNKVIGNLLYRHVG